MPISYFISMELDLVFARWEGAITAQDAIDNFETYLNDINYMPGRREFVDMSSVTALNMEYRAIRYFLQSVNAQNAEPVRTQTVLYSPQDAVFGVGRMYQQLAELAGGIEVEVYREETEALAAMELPHESIAALAADPSLQPPQRRTVPAAGE